MFSSYPFHPEDKVSAQSFTIPIEGQTVRHTQPGSVIPNPEVLLQDGTNKANAYPFECNSTNITQIETKLENTALTINPNQIIADKPILFQCIGQILRIWNYSDTPNNVISNKGNTYTDGYNILDFDNNPIKSAYQYVQKNWTINNSLLQNFSLKGNNNTLYVNQKLSNNFSLNILGENSIHFDVSSEFNDLNISTTHGLIDFRDSNCNNLKLELKGIGLIKNLTVRQKSHITLIGPSVLTLNKKKDTVCQTNITGTGNVIWHTI
jgi:hypothetical protein